jgi:hypothetical protein
VSAGLAYTDTRGRVYFDETKTPVADGGIVRAPARDELIPIPDGAVVTMLPGRAARGPPRRGAARPNCRSSATRSRAPSTTS